MSDEPSGEKVIANIVQHPSSSEASNDFKFAELIKNPNISLDAWSSSNLLFNEPIAMSTITRSNQLQRLAFSAYKIALLQSISS